MHLQHGDKDDLPNGSTEKVRIYSIKDGVGVGHPPKFILRLSPSFIRKGAPWSVHFSEKELQTLITECSKALEACDQSHANFHAVRLARIAISSNPNSEFHVMPVDTYHTNYCEAFDGEADALEAARALPFDTIVCQDGTILHHVRPRRSEASDG